MLVKIILIASLFLGGFLIYVAKKPSDMRISRQLLIKATPEKLFPYINNSKKVNDWMPWQDSDPALKMQYSGPEEGVGATSSWDSPGKMGTGNAVVVESIPNQLVRTQLTYTKPMQMSQLAEMLLTPTDGGTTVQWSVTGKNSFICRLFSVFMDMDKMVGGEFEKGLNQLKKKAENS